MKNSRTVYRRPDGMRVNQRNDSDRASSLHRTEREAVSAARQMLENQGGGELAVKGINGKIKTKDTVWRGNDPNPPRDKRR